MKNKKRLVYADEVEDLISGLDSLPWEEDVQTLVNSLSTADAVEVRHGRWHLIDFAGTVRCSICGYETSADIPFVDNGEKWVPLYATKYCGNCGAKMDKEN